MGMQPRNYFLLTKQIDDKFIALTKKGNLITWSTTTGKYLHKGKNTQLDWNKFKIFQTDENDFTYKREHNQVILLHRTDHEEVVDQKEFFDS